MIPYNLGKLKLILLPIKILTKEFSYKIGKLDFRCLTKFSMKNQNPCFVGFFKYARLPFKIYKYNISTLVKYISYILKQKSQP